MALLARILTRVERWHEAREKPNDPLPADPLGDLKTAQNALSFWEIAHDASNLADIVIAFVSNGSDIVDIDVAMIDATVVPDLGIAVRVADAETPFARVNSQHRNLENLKAHDLLRLADVIRRRGTFDGFLKEHVATLLLEAEARGDVTIRPRLNEKLGKYRASLSSA